MNLLSQLKERCTQLKKSKMQRGIRLLPLFTERGAGNGFMRLTTHANLQYALYYVLIEKQTCSEEKQRGLHLPFISAEDNSAWFPK